MGSGLLGMMFWRARARPEHTVREWMLIVLNFHQEQAQIARIGSIQNHQSKSGCTNLSSNLYSSGKSVPLSDNFPLTQSNLPS